MVARHFGADWLKGLLSPSVGTFKIVRLTLLTMSDSVIDFRSVRGVDVAWFPVSERLILGLRPPK